MNDQRNVILGTIMSAVILSILSVYGISAAHAYHDSLVTKQYAIKNGNVLVPSKHTISLSGKITNLKGAQSKDPATIDMMVHTWNQFKQGTTYSIESGLIETGSQMYKIDHGVMITGKTDEFLIIMKNQRGELLGKLYGYLNGGYKELQENKPVKLQVDGTGQMSLSNDGKQLPRKGTFIAEYGMLSPVTGSR